MDADHETGAEQVATWRRDRPRTSERHGLYDPAHEHDACGVGCVVAIDGQPRREVVLRRHRGAEGGLAPRRGRRRRQDRRRRRHPRRRSRRTSSAQDQGRGAARDQRIAVGMVFLPRDRASAQQEACRTIVESEILRLRLRDLRLAPGAGRHLGARREGDRDPARDRADHRSATRSSVDERSFERDLYLIRRRIEKQALAAQHHRVLHLLAVLPLDDLQGPVPGRSAGRCSTRTCRTSASSPASRCSTSATRPTPCRPGGWRSRSAPSPTTARSTRSAATSTG